MTMASRLILITIFISISYVDCVQTVNGRVKIFIGLTSGCPNARNFITSQLVPAYAEYGKFLDLEFVPWGKTERHENGTVTCQFGDNDCWANRLQRCVLNHLRGNPDAQLQYMACEYRQPYPAFQLGSFQCAREAGMRIAAADFCVNNPQIDTLDEEAEAKSTDPIEIIGVVPSIVFNDNIDVSTHWQAFRRLASVVCFALADDSSTGVLGCQI